MGGDTVRGCPEGSREGADPKARRGTETRREESGAGRDGRSIGEKGYERWTNNANEGTNKEDTYGTVVGRRKKRRAW